MTNQPQPTDRPLKLLLIDDDPIFRLGLSAALEGYPDLQIIAQADTSAIPEGLTQQPPDIVVLEPGIGRAFTELTVLQQWQQLRSRYPETPILLLSANPPPQNLQSFGISGYCTKGTAIDELVAAIRQVATGENYWQLQTISAPVRQSPRRRRQWFSRMGHSGVKQIDQELAAVERHLCTSQLPLFDWLYWGGRKRELLSARWLVSQLLPNEDAPVFASTFVPVPPTSELPVSIAPAPSGSLASFDHTFSQIQLRIRNLTGVPFEIEILRQPKQQELLYLILNQIEKILAELRFLQVTLEQLPQKIPLILRELWQSSTIEFISRNYLPTDVSQIDLADILLREAVFVQADILTKIPFATELFSDLLFSNSIDKNVIRPLDASENLEEILLQNLVIQEANAVMQTVLNNFYGVEELKHNLYSDRFISSRDMAQFRNNISWKYRQEKYLEEPKNIFESKYRLFYFSSSGIRKFTVYAPRQDELNQLSGIPWGVTIALEVRDALAPRLQAVVDFVGRGVVYVLTEVIGKGIGLIGRGVILGIGNVLQETRYRKNSERGKQ